MKIEDKEFEPFIDDKQIAVKVKEMANLINQDYAGRKPVFLVILNGAFMFAADLMKEIDLSSEVSFIKLSSYQDMASTGQVQELIGLNNTLAGQDIIIVEDIIDTGETMSHLLKKLEELVPRSVEIATLLLKPEMLQKDIEMKYVGFKIPAKFVVGYGLDYNGFGRNWKEIHQLKEEH
ncbi:MAG: hypoxanthine phosphoribosyltransferase [Cyclobacteriaceae bacterium]